MTDAAVTFATFVVERSFKANPTRVFSALSEPEIRRGWYAEDPSHDVLLFESEFLVGGFDRLQYRFGESTPFPGVILANDGQFQDIVPNQRIVTTSSTTIGSRPISVSLTTYELVPTEAGTDLTCTNQVAFFEGSDGPIMREQGWRVLLDKLCGSIET